MVYKKTGENLQHLWFKADKPERVGTCKKLRQGQLLMYKYKFLYDYYKGDDLYRQTADNCKRDSVILAARMVKHAEDCATCIAENVLNEVFFYGVFK